jgi:hypothetical protein
VDHDIRAERKRTLDEWARERAVDDERDVMSTCHFCHACVAAQFLLHVGGSLKDWCDDGAG